MLVFLFMIYPLRAVLLSFISCCLAIFIFNSAAPAQDGVKIKLIDITGSRRIEKSTILTKIRTKKGDTFSADTIREDIKSLYATDYFDDIRVESEAWEDGL